MEPTVSVIIPTYGSNTDPCRAVKSVLEQDYPFIQVVIVDDNGEGTAQQIENAKRINEFNEDERVIYCVHQHNRGGSAARNTGVNSSSGEFLCFLDDDDEFTDKSKVSKQMRVALTLDQSWAGTYSSCDIYKGNEFVRTVLATKSGKILVDYMTERIRIETACPIISRQAYDSVGGFDESFKRHQDWEFFSRVLDKYNIKAVEEASYSRYYKLDVQRKSAETRLEYMDKFASAMRREIKSLNSSEIDKIIKKKYIPIVFILLKEKKFLLAKKVMRDNSFNFFDYCDVIVGALKYVFKRIKYGSHF